MSGKLAADEHLSEIIKQRGYLVICTSFEHRIGDILKNKKAIDFVTEQPFVVISETTLDDANEQDALLGRLLEVPVPLVGWHGKHFYRVSTD